MLDLLLRALLRGACTYSVQELARADPGSEPDTVDAFERLVVSQPDSSHAWIRYMAFLLTLGDADGARAVAERALNTINYR